MMLMLTIDFFIKKEKETKIILGFNTELIALIFSCFFFGLWDNECNAVDCNSFTRECSFFFLFVTFSQSCYYRAN